MDKYAGMDVHATSCTLVVVSSTGKKLQSKVVETKGNALVEAVKGIGGQVHLCIEEGTQSGWLYEVLHHRVKEFIVVGVPEKKQRGQKNDEVDAERLAQSLRLGAIGTRVYKDLGPYATLRAAVKTYGFMTEDLVRAENRLKAAYRSQGIPTPGTAIYSSEQRDEWLAKLPAKLRPAAECLHDAVEYLDLLRLAAEDEMLKESSKHGIIRTLKSCPGMGPIRTAQLVATVVTPHRFRQKRQFWAYCGLAIQMRSSSDWVPGHGKGQWERAKVSTPRGLNHNHNHMLKNVFKGAAGTVIHHLPDSPLHLEYTQLLEKGTKPNLAALTIARKIAAIVLRMWKDATRYQANLHVAKQPRQPKERQDTTQQPTST
jgi:transposase